MRPDVLMSILLPVSSLQSQQSPAAETLVPVSATESLLVTTAGSGTTIVLIPGLFGSAFGYRHLLELLPAAGFQAVVIEPLGVGRSPRPRRSDYSLTAQADRLAAVLHARGAQSVVVVAHSVGASMALRLAYRHPELVGAVIALDGGPSEQAATRGLRRAMRYAPWIKWLGGVRRLRPHMRKELIAASGNPSWVTPEVMDGYTAGAIADLDGTLLAYLAMSEAREPERLAPNLGAIRCPVRLVVGTAAHQGGVDEKHVRLLLEKLPNFSIDSVPGAGQYLFEEQPSAVVRVIKRVVATTQTSTIGSLQ